MNFHYGFLVYLGLGLLGGLVGAKLRIPAGSLIVAMLFIIVFKLITSTDWEPPRGFNFVLQVLLGVMVGTSFHPSMIPLLKTIFFPVLTSTLTLAGVGILLSLLFTRMGVMNAPTAYLGTSPGAMSALIVLALEGGGNSTLVVCFHFFRVVFVILTAPLMLKLFSYIHPG